MPNLTRGDLRAFLPQYNLPDEQTDMVILLVRGWLLDATGLDTLPDPLGDVLWSAALELAALLASNPESLAQKTVGPTSRSWPMASRRDMILARLIRRYRAERMAPQGSYPAAGTYPEAARGGYVGPNSAVWVDGWTVIPL